MNYPQQDKDLLVTATLRAADWRMVCYAMEHMVDYRASIGHEDVSRNYDKVAQKLYKELNIVSSGNLPVDTRSS